jgi:energy-converting hydrogenase Eha subunit H
LVSGALEEVRPRLVAGWIGIGSVIAAITWMVEGSLLRRAAFLAIAGIAAIGLAAALGRLTHGDRRQ